MVEPECVASSPLLAARGRVRVCKRASEQDNEGMSASSTGRGRGGEGGQWRRGVVFIINRQREKGDGARQRGDRASSTGRSKRVREVNGNGASYLLSPSYCCGVAPASVLSTVREMGNEGNDKDDASTTVKGGGRTRGQGQGRWLRCHRVLPSSLHSHVLVPYRRSNR